MGKKTKKAHSKRRIADEIMFQVGRSVLLVFLIVAVVSVFLVRWLVTSSKETELELQSASAADRMEGFFVQYTKTSAQLAINPEIRYVLSETTPGDSILDTDKMETVKQNLINVVETDSENIMATWIADLDTSTITQSDGFTSGPEWDITTRVWYEDCIGGEKTVLTEPYTDPATGKVIISAITPVYGSDGKEILGAAGVDISLERLTDVMDTYKIGKKGYVFLASSDGIIIYHPQEDLKQKNLKDAGVSQNVLDAMNSGDEQFLKYKVGGVTKYGAVQNVGSTGYTVTSNMPFMEYYSLLFGIMAALAAIFVIGIVMIAFSIRKSAASLSKPIMDLNNTAQKLAGGNLDVHIEIISEDEIGELGASIGKTVTRLKEYIVYIDETAEVLSHIADGKLGIELKNDYTGEFQKIKKALLNISSSMIDLMKSISESSEQVSIGASELSDASQMIAEGAQVQAEAVQELAAATNTVTEQVQKSRKDAEASAKATVNVTKMMEDNKDKMKLMMNAMDGIHETSQQVVGIIQTIEEIAEQTNLLSLNASIEAARAGESGKGFAVVADEIGKLALESSKAANMTRELIGVSMEEINKGNDIANDVMESLEESVNAVDHVNRMIREVAENAADQADNMEKIRTGVDGIAQGVNDNSAVSQETYATSEQLANQTVSLNDLVQKFEF